MCCITIIDYATHKVVEEVSYSNEITSPYISGFLAFRELPLVLNAVKKLNHKPDIYLFDGNGYLHERNMGIATHASFYLNKPTIGVAKTYYKIQNVEFVMPQRTKGSFENIAVGGTIYGRALRTRENVKPIFVSCGNWVDLETATEIVMSLVEKESRLPIPTRYADLATHRHRERLKGEFI